MNKDISVYSIEEFVQEVYKDKKFEQKFTIEFYKFIKESLINQTVLQCLLDKKSTSYIAGGFARWILFCANRLEEKELYCTNHLKQLEKYKNNISSPTLYDCFSFMSNKKEPAESVFSHILNYYLWNLNGDIDIFFEKEESNLYKTYTTKFAKSFPVGFILNCSCASKKTEFLVQHILYRKGPIVDVLNTFDINNARIAIDFRNDKVYAYNKLIELENNNTFSFHTKHENEIEVVNRLYKYVSKHYYKNLSKEDGSLEYFIRWCHKNLRKKEASLLNEENFKQQLNKLKQIVAHTTLIDVKQLPLFIGFVTTDIKIGRLQPDGRSYYSYIDIDTAANALKNRVAGKFYPLKMNISHNLEEDRKLYPSD